MGVDTFTLSTAAIRLRQELLDARDAPERPDISAAMKKENIFISPELVFIDNEIYQAFHGLTRINRIQQYTLVSGDRRKGSEHGDRRRATDGRDVIGIYRDITLRRESLDSFRRHPRRLAHYQRTMSRRCKFGKN
ncbi:MAG: hypothetical protein ACYDAE_14340 [Steroidobacteraceae bacterium]